MTAALIVGLAVAACAAAAGWPAIAAATGGEWLAEWIGLR